MFKRIAIIFIAIVIIINFYFLNCKPIFTHYSSNLELYLNSPSSSAQIVNVKINKPILFSKLYGESFKVERKDFNLQKFLTGYQAELVFVEEIKEGTSYYAYSPKIKYRARLFDKTINLHIFIGNQVTVGAPLIFGSF